MEGQKFILKSKAALGALTAIFAAGYLVFTGTPPDPSAVAEVGSLADQAGDQLAGVVALVGSVVALYGRLVAKKEAVIIPK